MLYRIGKARLGLLEPEIAAMLGAIAKAVTGYEAIVVERFSEYTFSLSFVGDAPGFVDVARESIVDAVEVVKTAHLRFIFEPITWGQLEAVLPTWGEVEALGKTWGELADMVPVFRKGRFDMEKPRS